VLALPLSITRESLRPYGVAGFGLVQARSSDVLGELPISRNMPGFTVGGGAIGFVTPDAGARFDLRYIRALGREEGGFVRAGVARLSFWRASVGLVVRLQN
jgi:hypothetical protein